MVGIRLSILENNAGFSQIKTVQIIKPSNIYLVPQLFILAHMPDVLSKLNADLVPFL